MLHLLALNREYSRLDRIVRLPDVRHLNSLCLCCWDLSRRINIGLKYQAEIPELQDQLSSQFDQHKADLVWLPVDDSHFKQSDQQRSSYLTLPFIH